MRRPHNLVLRRKADSRLCVGNISSSTSYNAVVSSKVSQVALYFMTVVTPQTFGYAVMDCMFFFDEL